MYPALTRIFGVEYVEKLILDHDRAIAVARRLLELADKDLLTDAEVAAAARLIRTGILPHVSDCDGLSIVVEKLPETIIEGILDARKRSLAEGLDLPWPGPTGFVPGRYLSPVPDRGPRRIPLLKQARPGEASDAQRPSTLMPNRSAFGATGPDSWVS